MELDVQLNNLQDSSEKLQEVLENVTQEEDQLLDKEEESCPGSEFHDDLFSTGRERRRLSRSQKRAVRHQYQCLQRKSTYGILDMSSAELQRLQSEDPTLQYIKKEAEEAKGDRFFIRNKLLYRYWTPRNQRGEGEPQEQLILPRECRKPVLHLAHGIPLAGHLGKEKTAKRILQRFYWPTIYQDVKEHCRTCESCQKSTSRRVQPAPMIPLPVMSEPFHRIAMDIVGPLPRSRSGNQYILVVCDYATRYPEAVPLRSIDAGTIAEELIKFFSRVGIPEEVLTDQGSNFTSQLLREIYSMLHVSPIRTSLYHPQTDGLVERFNQTLTAMIRKTAVTETEGKDWDKLIPILYLLIGRSHKPQRGFLHSNSCMVVLYGDHWTLYENLGKPRKEAQRVLCHTCCLYRRNSQRWLR